MHFLKRIAMASLAGMCMLAATSTLAVDPPAHPDETARQQHDNALLVDALLAEATPRSMVLAATSLFSMGPDAQAIQQRKYDLLKQAAQRAPDDAWVQWFAALHADPAEGESKAALVLQQLEPDNGAVWLLPLSTATRANDDAGITDALARIGTSPRFDDRFIAFTLEWLDFFRAHPGFLGGTDKNGAAHSTPALDMAIGRAAALAMPNLADALRACRSIEQPLTVKRREACLDAGRLIANESNTFTAQALGIAMLRSAGAEDVAELTRSHAYLARMSVGVFDGLHEDPQALARYQSDLLKTGSEIQAVRNALTRAGTPLVPPADWKPDAYPQLENGDKAHVG